MVIFTLHIQLIQYLDKRIFTEQKQNASSVHLRLPFTVCALTCNELTEGKNRRLVTIRLILELAHDCVVLIEHDTAESRLLDLPSCWPVCHNSYIIKYN